MIVGVNVYFRQYKHSRDCLRVAVVDVALDAALIALEWCMKVMPGLLHILTTISLSRIPSIPTE